MSSNYPLQQQQQPLSDFEKTVRDQDDLFFTFFPQAKYEFQAETPSESYDANSFFGGASFAYDNGFQLNLDAGVGAPSDRGYLAVGGGESSTLSPHHVVSPYIPHPANLLHYDYDVLSPVQPSSSSFIPDNHIVPLTSQPNASSRQYSTPAGLTSYPEPHNSSIPPIQTPPLQHAYYIPGQQIPHGQPEAHRGTHHCHPHTQHAHLDLHRIRSSPSSQNLVQSPVDVYSPNGLFFPPPDTPSDLASSPGSEIDEFPESIAARVAGPSHETHHPLHRPANMPSQHQLQGTEPHSLPSDSDPNRASPSRPGRPRQHDYNHRHARSLSHLPSHSDKVTIRGMSWVDPHSSTISSSSRPSMRLSPLPSKRQLEKKPPLACLFCRGRKIACGPPLPGSTDKTCNQCQRRSLHCEYPSESRRGMRKKKVSDPSDSVDKEPGASLPVSDSAAASNPTVSTPPV